MNNLIYKIIYVHRLSKYLNKHYWIRKLFVNKFFSKSDTNTIVSYMRNDKKNNSDKINLVLLRKIGSIDLKKKFNQQKIKFFIKEKLFN